MSAPGVKVAFNFFFLVIGNFVELVWSKLAKVKEKLETKVFSVFC